MTEKVVIITGGTSGIGRALAFAFGQRHHRIVITGRNEEELSAMKTAFAAQRIDGTALRADVTSDEDAQRVMEETLRTYGRIDILINNAGISMRAMFGEVNLRVIQRVMEVNFFGAVRMTRACLPEILKQKGSVVGVSSIAGFRGLPARTGYSASKFALNGFLEALRTELLPTGVHVLTACPGFTASNIRKRALTRDGSAQGESPRKEAQMMTAEQCAEAIYKAVVARRRTLILTAQGKLAVWMNKWFPSLADRLVYGALAKEEDSPLR